MLVFLAVPFGVRSELPTRLPDYLSDSRGVHTANAELPGVGWHRSLKIQRYVAALLFSDSFLNNNAGIRWPLARPTGDQSRCVLEKLEAWSVRGRFAGRERPEPRAILANVAMTGSADLRVCRLGYMVKHLSASGGCLGS